MTDTNLRNEIADEISSVPVGEGYESTNIGIVAALEAADAILSVFDVNPRGKVTDKHRVVILRELLEQTSDREGDYWDHETLTKLIAAFEISGEETTYAAHR